MTIEAKVQTRAKHVFAVNDTQVVEYLRCAYPTRSARRVDVRLIDVVEVEWRHVGPDGIRFALREEKTEPAITGGELIHHARRDYASPTDREIRGATEYFTLRRIVGIDLRAAV